MSTIGWVAIYSAAILVASLFGGWIPLIGRVSHSRLQLYLSLSAGVMLGASFFHVMPEAIALCGGHAFGWWMSLGAVGLFCIERFIAPHSHETSSKLQDEHDHEPGCEHDHQHHAAPAVAGWMAVLGLTIHTFMNGVGLGGAVKEGIADGASWEAGVLPGLAMFLAIVLHKPADALAISTVLSRKHVSRGKLALVLFGFAAMVPVGAAVFLVSAGSIEQSMQNQLTGAALAFSAGTFLFIALSDLLPEVQFHRHDRVPLFLALVAGVVLMGGIGILEGHDHGHGGHDHAGHSHGAEKAADDHGHDHGHDHSGHSHGKDEHK